MSWQLFDRVRAFLRAGNVYRYENLQQDQPDVQRVLAGGRWSLNAASSGVILEQTNLSINRMERYKDYDQMDEMGEVSAALDIYADEGTLIDPDLKHSLMVRSPHQRVKRELEDLFYTVLSTDNGLRSWFRYLVKYGDLPLEIVPTRERNGVASLRFMNVYNFSRVETKKGDLIGFFYQDENDPRPNFLHPWQVVHFRLTSFENIFHPYGRALLEGGRKDFKRLRLMEDAALIYRICLTGDSKIWTPGGYKPIVDVKPGDEVFSYDASKKLVKTKVCQQVCNGIKPVYEVKTKHYSLRGTATHPFLVRDLVDGLEKYVDLKDLDPQRHILVSPRVAGEGTCKRIDLWFEKEYGCLKPEAQERFRSTPYDNITPLMRQIDHPVYLTRQVLYLGKGMPYDKLVELCGLLGLDANLIDKYSPLCKGGGMLPSAVTSELARFIGFWFGDGYVTDVNWRVGICLGSDAEVNEHYVKLFKKLHQRVKIEFKNVEGGKIPNTALVCDKQFYHTWLSLGLNGHAHTKRIPQWVYELPTSHKIEFLRGMIDADGTVRSGAENDYYEVEICNKQLLEDLQVLCDQIGWVTGRIRTRSREGGLPHMQGCYESHCLYINPVFKVGYEKIEDISYVGDEAVYDITVENENHNFVANGLVVHNTRAPERRIFEVPIGEIPTQQVMQYLDNFARNLKKRRFFNPSTGQLDERWSPLIQEDDYILPRRPDGSGPKVDTLPGAENLDQIADIEYFKKKLISALKIPFSRVGIGESGEDSRQSLSQVAPEFAKAVQWIQRAVCIGLQKIALVHLSLKNYDLQELKDFHLYMTAGSAIDELYRIEKWSTRAEVMTTLKDFGPPVSPQWILRTFTDLTDDEIKDMQKEGGAAGLPELPALGELGPELGPGGAPPAGPGGAPAVPEAVAPEERVLLEGYAAWQRQKADVAIIQSGQNLAVKLVNEHEFDGLTKDGKLLVESLAKEEGAQAVKDVCEETFLTERAEWQKGCRRDERRRKLIQEVLNGEGQAKGGEVTKDGEVTEDDVQQVAH